MRELRRRGMISGFRIFEGLARKMKRGGLSREVIAML